MFCPQCGQERVSIDTNYCSRCGFLLTATTELLQTGGQNPLAVSRSIARSQSARKRGMKQGLFLLLSTFLVAPLMGMITIALNIEPFLVGIAVIICFVGGLLRMVYAAMFESAEAGAPTLEDRFISGAVSINSQHDHLSLTGAKSVPASDFISSAPGNWRDTNDLQPTSVTESTTKLLSNDESFQ